MRFLRLLHAWTGVFLALVIAAIAAAGAFSALRAEFIRLDVHAARAPAPPASRFGEALTNFEMAHPGQFQSVKFAPYGLGVHRMFLKEGKSAFITATGRVADEWGGGKRRFEELALNFHHTLFLGPKGRFATGLVAILGVAMTLSGLILIVPLFDGFPYRIWPGSLARRDLLVAHRDLSLVLAVFLLIQLPTGATIAFEPEIRRLFHDQAAADPPKTPPAPPGAMVDWRQMLVVAQQQYPGAAIRRAFAPRTENGPYLVYLSPAGDKNPEGSAVVYLDWQATPLGKMDNRDVSTVQRVHNQLFALHSGTYAGKWSRYFAAFVGLGLCITALIGAASYLQVLMPRRRKPRA